MKSILLASASIVAFAGAAAADGHTGVSFTGSATLGFNDGDDPTVGDDGFYWETDITAILSAELDNGITATVSWDVDVASNDGDDNLGQDLSAGDFALSLTSETASLFFGDVGPAADSLWESAGDMEADGFSANDGAETYLRGDVRFLDNYNLSLSYVVDDDDNDNDDDEVEQLSVAVSGAVSTFDFVVAYQEEELDYISPDADFNGDEIFALSVSSTFAGADVTVAYADNSTADLESFGVEVSYPLGPVTITAYYVAEDGGLDEDNYGINLAYSEGPLAVTFDYVDEQDNEIISLDGSYEITEQLSILAGFSSDDAQDDDEYYLGAEYDLGGGAELIVAFADGDDEVGSPEYEDGTTVEVSFDF